MACSKCNDTGFEIIERRVGADGRTPVSAVKRCDCRPVPAPPDPGKTPLTEEIATAGARVLMEYFAFAPKGDSAETMVANGLMNMCSTVEQLNWLIPRACELYTTWGGKSGCGLPALRQILGSKFTPRDGQFLLSTEAFPDGMPPERQLPEPANTFKALPPGAQHSAAPSVERIIHDLAPEKSMRLKRPNPVGSIPLKPGQAITQADIDRAVADLHQQRSKELNEQASQLIGKELK